MRSKRSETLTNEEENETCLAGYGFWLSDCEAHDLLGIALEPEVFSQRTLVLYIGAKRMIRGVAIGMRPLTVIL